MGAKAFITSILTDLVMSFNVGKTMNQMQVVQAVGAIQTNYYYLKPSELKYCFDRAKSGYYGSLYDRIDQSIIFEWIENYLDDRFYQVEIDRQNEHEFLKKNGTPESNLIQNFITDARFNLNAKQKDEENTNASKENLKPLNQTKLPYHDLHQKWLSQFDKLRKRFPGMFYNEETGQWNENDRFIKRYGKIMNVEEFFAHKAEQLIKIKNSR